MEANNEFSLAGHNLLKKAKIDAAITGQIDPDIEKANKTSDNKEEEIKVE